MVTALIVCVVVLFLFSLAVGYRQVEVNQEMKDYREGYTQWTEKMLLIEQNSTDRLNDCDDKIKAITKYLGAKIIRKPGKIVCEKESVSNADDLADAIRIFENQKTAEENQENRVAKRDMGGNKSKPTTGKGKK